VNQVTSFIIFCAFIIALVFIHAEKDIRIKWRKETMFLKTRIVELRHQAKQSNSKVRFLDACIKVMEQTMHDNDGDEELRGILNEFAVAVSQELYDTKEIEEI
jgi:hypothetical protein